MNHLVFSTRERRPTINGEIMPRLIEYTGGIIRNLGGSMLEMNGILDHVHIIAIMTAKIAVSDQLRDIKADTSKWIHQTFPGARDFAWQEGYGAFSVSKSNVPTVVRYIQGQVQHHRKMTFEEEFIKLLEKHEIEYDPKYVFD